jgi:hypothetical protein
VRLKHPFETIGTSRQSGRLLFGLSSRAIKKPRAPDVAARPKESFFSFNDPDHNTWLVQEVTTPAEPDRCSLNKVEPEWLQ